MNKTIIKLSLAVFAIGISNVLFAQTKEEVKAAKAEEKRLKEIPNWYNGGGAGMDTEKAYKMVKKRTSQTVIVAIIDSGMDIEHEDLQGRIWTNEDEIPGNGIDDDNNGYVDDVHGWNFLGNANGENANDIRLEMTRIYAELDKKYGNMPVTIGTEEEIAEYELYLEVKEEVESNRNYAAQVVPIIKQRMSSATGEEKAQLEGALAYFETQLNVHYNPDHNGRAIVGDDPNDFTDTNYGNNDVEGPDALHGTHVGGIVGAVRGNGVGYDGVADNVLLMSIRAVPNGDEFDKDIALAIRYAVDNGAQVINMSFGKAYSPHAEEVYNAFKYADSKGVLLVHAAGNDHKNIDKEPNYPTSMYEFQDKKLDHFLTIGASTRYLKEDMLAAPFSNYAKRGVDVFAPGFEILNTVPQSEYQELQEMPGGASRDEELKSDMVDFGNLSVTGGVINLKAAVQMCLEMEK